MKEATGQLSSAVVVIICVAIFIAFFYYTAWPIIKRNFDAQTACEKAVCETSPDSDGMVNCVLDSSVFKCKYKG